jgi:thioredoxin reductase
MPRRTYLKSDGFASSLYDPGSTFTLANYCRQNLLPYSDVGFPVPIETFIDYGIEFQKRFVRDLEETDVTAIERTPDGFEVATEDGSLIRARRVVVAAGISHFGHVPPMVANMPRELLTHSSEHNELSKFRGRTVAVLGAGASAVDIAGLLHEAGAETHLVARRSAISFHEPSVEPRPIIDRILNPRSGLGLGWRSRLCSDAPLLFHAMPYKVRRRAVQRHLGPAGGWSAKSRFEGHVTAHLGTRMKAASVRGDSIYLNFEKQDGSDAELKFDHVIAATGYKVSMQRLRFLQPTVRKQLETVEDSPILSSNFESSVKGLYFVGLASSNSFGPVCRFACGAQFASERVSRHLALRS